MTKIQWTTPNGYKITKRTWEDKIEIWVYSPDGYYVRCIEKFVK